MSNKKFFAPAGVVASLPATRADPSAPALLQRAFAFAALVLLAAYVVILMLFVVDWPLHDDFTQILAIPAYVERLATWPERFALFTALELEHRAATVRVLGWLASMLPSGMSFALLIALGNAMLVGAAAIAATWYPRGQRGAALLLAALLMLSLTHYAAQFHATGALQHFGVSFYSLAALYFLDRGHRLFLPAALAIAATFTSASGLLVIPAAALLLALRARRTEALAWTIATVLAGALYFVGTKSPHMGSVARILFDNPLHVAGLALTTLGCIGAAQFAALGIGTLTVVAWGYIVAGGAWRRVPPVVIAAALALALTCAMIAVGRATLGPESVIISRYRVYSGLLVLLTVAALAWTLHERRATTVTATAIAGAVALYLQAWPMHLPWLFELSMRQIALRDHFAADGRGHHVPYNREWGDYTLKKAAALGAYRPSSSPPSVPEAMTEQPQHTSRALSVHLEFQDGQRVASVSGFVRDNCQALELWFVRDGAAYRAPLATTRFPAGLTGGLHTGFHGTVDVTQLASGRYRIGIASGEAIAWVAHEVVAASR